jgi:hypothetical protein
VPVRLPEEKCRCCLFPATRRVWVRWDRRWSTADAVPCCDEHAAPAGSRFRSWLTSIRPADFRAERSMQIRAEDADNARHRSKDEK